MLKKYFPIYILFMAFGVQAQEDLSLKYANTITRDDLKKHVIILASDLYEGRETGEPGNDLAADYIAEAFSSIDIAPLEQTENYFQPVAFTWHTWDNNTLDINGSTYKHLWDYYTLPQYNTNIKELNVNELVFMGYGIKDNKYNDYKKVNNNSLVGKTIIFYNGEPTDNNDNYRISGSRAQSKWSTEIIEKLKVAKTYGVAQVIIIDPVFDVNVSRWRGRMQRSYLSLGESLAPLNLPNSFYISPEMASSIFGKKTSKVEKRIQKITKKGKAKPIKIQADISLSQSVKHKHLKGQNVIGYIEGSDPILKNELLILTAHYDHLGKRGMDIFNGADDNASGTSAIIELADAYMQAKNEGHGAKRSILCMLMTGEEKGLLGSKYYTEDPIFPLKDAVANFNIDMIGRIDEHYEGNPDYIYVIGADRISTDLHDINEASNKKYTQLTLDYKYNAESDPNRYYYRSDHYNFAKNGIPSVFYFNGTHDDYHRTTDTSDKIDFPKMEKITRFIFHTTWNIANRSEKLVRDKWVEPSVEP